MIYNYLISFLFILFFFSNSYGQITAVTERGDTIYVYNNGTWSFEQEEAPVAITEMDFLNEKLTIDSVTQKFVFGDNANKEIKSKYGFFKIKYNSKNWKRIPPAELNPDAEFAFTHKKKDIFAMVISEEIEIGQENIVKIARKMMRDNTGGKLLVKKTESRNVNEVDILRGVNEVNANGLNMIFDAYYFSNEKGTLQFTIWTGTNLYPKNEEEILEFLNGLIIEE